MSGTNLLGPMVSGADVEAAMVAFLDAPRGASQVSWIDYYLGEVERLQGYDAGSIQRPLGVVTSSDFEKWPEDQIPVYVVICAGLAQPPIRHGDGSYEARFGVGVAAVASDPGVDGTSQASSRKLAMAHALAIRTAVVQHQSLGGFAETTTWRDEAYADLPFDDTRSLGSARVIFEVVVLNTVDASSGPSEPVPPPSVDPGPWPTVTEIDVGVTKVPITEAVHA